MLSSEEIFRACNSSSTIFYFGTDDMPAVKTVGKFVEDLEAFHHHSTDYLEHARQVQSREVNKGRLRPKVMSIGDLVMLSTQYIQPAFMRVTGSRNLRAKYIGPFVITKRVSPTSFELDLPANLKVHPVINIEYLKKFHASPPRFVNRPDDGLNHMMNSDDAVDSEEIEQIGGQRESRQGQMQYLSHYKGTTDHDDVWEHASRMTDNSSVRDVLSKYWKDVYHEQDDHVLPKKEEKKQRNPRKEKAMKEKQAMKADEGQAARQKQRPKVEASETDATAIAIRQERLQEIDKALHVKSSNKTPIGSGV